VSHPTTIKSEATSSDRSVTKGSSSEYEENTQDNKDITLVKDVEKALIRLHDSIRDSNVEEFKKVVDPGVTAFDIGCKGHLLNGLSYHEFNINAQSNIKKRFHINNTSIKLLSSKTAITTCSIVKQTTHNSTTSTNAFDETRVWEKSKDGNWRNVHIHLS
jgi:hypothetical protein